MSKHAQVTEKLKEPIIKKANLSGEKDKRPCWLINTLCTQVEKNNKENDFQLKLYDFKLAGCNYSVWTWAKVLKLNTWLL